MKLKEGFKMSGRLFERENQKCYLERGNIYVSMRNEQSFNSQRWTGEFFREVSCMSRMWKQKNMAHVLIMVNDPFWRSTGKVNEVLGGSHYSCQNGHLDHCQLLSLYHLVCSEAPESTSPTVPRAGKSTPLVSSHILPLTLSH